LSKAFKQTSTATSKTAFLTPSSVSQLPKGVSFSCTPSPVGSFLEEDIFHDCAASSDDILTVLHGSISNAERIYDEETLMSRGVCAAKSGEKLPSLALGQISSRRTTFAHIEISSAHVDQLVPNMDLYLKPITAATSPIQISNSWRGSKVDTGSLKEVTSPTFQPPHLVMASTYPD